MHRIFAWSVLLIGLAQGLSAGQVTEATLETVVITARGRPTPLSQTPGAVSIANAEFLAEGGILTLPENLARLASVNQSADTPWGAEIAVRGLARDSVVFLIDGCRVNTATDLSGQYGLVSPGDIAHIEVIKGPISALYGSGSLGGVVNVITRTGRFTPTPTHEVSSTLNVRSNPQGFQSHGRGVWQTPDFYVTASQSYRDFDSYQDGDGTEIRNSQFQDAGTQARMGRHWNDDHVTAAQFQYVEGRNIGVPGRGVAPLPSTADVTFPRIRRGLFQVEHTYTPDGSVWERSRVNLFHQYIHRRAVLDNYPPVSPIEQLMPGANHDTWGAVWHNDLAGRNHEVAAGLDVWRRSLRSFRTRLFRTGRTVFEQPLPSSSFLSAGAYLEDTRVLTDTWRMNLGGRYDSIRVENDATVQWAEDTENDSSWNGHVGATWAFAPEWTLKAIVARGYRAASLEERFAYLELGGGQVKLGNPALDPEESLLGELGLHWTPERAELILHVYNNRLDNMISEERLDRRTLMNANVRRADITGVEIEGRWYPGPGMAIYGQTSYLRGRDRDDGEPLMRMPPLQGLLGMRYNCLQGGWFAIEGQAAAHQHRIPTGEPEGPGWFTLRLEAGYLIEDVGITHRITLGVDNLLDHTYQEYLTMARGLTYNQAGRSFWAGYEVKF